MPDVSYDFGAFPANEMRWIEGPPTFAVEVRSENDDGPSADQEIAARRAGYFEAGTPILWDVDPVAELIHAYRIEDPTRATIYKRGDVAEAEPAAPGLRLAVDRNFG